MISTKKQNRSFQDNYIHNAIAVQEYAHEIIRVLYSCKPDIKRVYLDDRRRIVVEWSDHYPKVHSKKFTSDRFFQICKDIDNGDW